MQTKRLQADACRHGTVDLVDTEHAGEILHVPAEVFAAFVRDVKSGLYDHLCPVPPGTDPRESHGGLPPAGGPSVS